ncbi:YraN family protein [Desulfuribacillus stibiiarsenatis]|uniref:UPF0102 protein BHU72_03185 n=1 Tax=Desulfuribacillus stibiiarsenatis TaxID=1390249 RepID=A0A1E5L738_9FIRM|nr:YraN family protein [Desulfuribacillus stibiiarsenatis]OEH85799.1 YraN family protein [Desulfuribacillus stibiiarsenatis]
MNHKALGTLGESIAKTYLEQESYQTVAMNWRHRFGEIDLIMLDPKGVLVLVEVKLRTTAFKGTGLDSIDYRKQQKLYQLFQLFLMKHPRYQKLPVRMDAISITYNRKLQKVEDVIHLQGI